LLNDETFRLPGSFGRLEKIAIGSVRFAKTNPRSSSPMTPAQSAKGPFRGGDAGLPVNNRKNTRRRARSARKMPTRTKNNRDAKQGDYSN